MELFYVNNALILISGIFNIESNGTVIEVLVKVIANNVCAWCNTLSLCNENDKDRFFSQRSCQFIK